jgi:hypothetical protein
MASSSSSVIKVTNFSPLFLLHFPRFVSLSCRFVLFFQDAKVLMVGAGGIGCELLKTLALSGFSDIHIVSSFILPFSHFFESLNFGLFFLGFCVFWVLRFLVKF